MGIVKRTFTVLDKKFNWYYQYNKDDEIQLLLENTISYFLKKTTKSQFWPVLIYYVSQTISGTK